jgi:phosphate transport system ATP-binding protein
MELMGKTHIEISDFNLYYKDEHALKNINISIPDKKITAIIGPSGCGKSSLLKSINRLIDCSDNVRYDGSILINGENILKQETEVTHLRKKMCLLLQKPYPLPMSIFNNIAFGLRIHGIKKKREIEDIVEFYLKEVALWDEVKNRLSSPASKLSLGQQQRLCLARGLAIKPDAILCDEPTSSLDPVSSQHIEKKIVELKKDYSIILVTHILRQAKKLADYVLFMYLGELIEHGPVEEIFNNPKHELTKSYVKGIFT